jgi:hypothetical protein
LFHEDLASPTGDAPESRELFPEGRISAHLARVGHLIAPHLGGGVALQVVNRGFGWAVIDL